MSEAFSSPLASHISLLVRVGDDVLNIAIRSILDTPNFVLSPIDRGDGLLLTDDLRWMGPRTVLITDTTFASAHRAYELVVSGRVLGACTRDDLVSLEAVVRAAAAGVSAVAGVLMRRVHEHAGLEDYDVELLELIALGLTNTQISSRMHTSLATTKRRISILMRIFSCTTRSELQRAVAT